MTTIELTSPPASIERPFTETIHGVDIADPFRWLEDGESNETKAWVTAQNEYTRSILDGLPDRARIRDRLAELMAIGSVTPPRERNGRLFYQLRGAEDNQPRLLVRDGLNGEDRVLCDPNQLDAAGTTAIDWWYPSNDGRYVAVGRSTSGDEQSTLYVMDAGTGAELADVIPHTRFAAVAWLPGSEAFYYSSTVKGMETADIGQAYRHRAVYLHHLGSDHAADLEVFPDDGDPETIPSVALSRDGRWLRITISRGWNSTRIFVCDLRAEGDAMNRASTDGGSAQTEEAMNRVSTAAGEFIEITTGMEANFFSGFADGRLYMMTNLEAPRYRILRADLAQPARAKWEEIVGEDAEATLQSFDLSQDRIILNYLSNAYSRVDSVGFDGGNRKTVDLPEIGTVAEGHADDSSTNVFFSLESYLSPPAIYRLDTNDGSLTEWQRPASDLDVSNLVTDQIWYPSKDGTQVSMFITHRRDIALDGTNPTVLTGYGGFNQNKTPIFDRAAMAWIESSGVFAMPNLRGGGEYGEAWHRAGMLEQKQNVYDDFIAAAEYLIGSGYTSPEHLGISGRSNGGLLVGAALTQRPDLFRAVMCGVPLLDMLRYQDFLIARLWIPEYGTAENPDQFEFLYEYSPYHHVDPSVEYPAILFDSGASDSRVDPMHARKMTALMQSRCQARGPILLRVEFSAGHGQGKPISKLVEQSADIWSYLMWQLRI